MPSKYKQNQYNDIFDKLPMPIKDLVASSETAAKVFKIAQTHRLQIDQADVLNQITLDVLMGITPAKDFLETIKKDIQIEPNEAIGVVNDINDQIFKPIREVMETSFNGGNPNKLRTITTIEENDEEHLHLTKHDILREIENPPEAVVKKIEGTEDTKVETPEISKTTEIEEYNQELLGNKIEIRKTEDPTKPKVVIPPQEKSISEIKLGGVASTEKANKIVEETKKAETTKPQIDPYREPVE
ncbi:MAG: hypothetical protein WCO18_01320 [bacterium]